MNSCTCKKFSETPFFVVLALTGECIWKSGKVTHHSFWKVPEAHSDSHKKSNVAKSKLQPKTLFTSSDDCHQSELASTFNWKDSKKRTRVDFAGTKSLRQEPSYWNPSSSKLWSHLVLEDTIQFVETHIRGHRSDGNQRNDKCNEPPCTSYFMCGQRKKHSEQGWIQQFVWLVSTKRNLSNNKINLGNWCWINVNTPAYLLAMFPAPSYDWPPQLYMVKPRSRTELVINSLIALPVVSSQQWCTPENPSRIFFEEST